MFKLVRCIRCLILLPVSWRKEHSEIANRAKAVVTLTLTLNLSLTLTPTLSLTYRNVSQIVTKM